MFYRDDYSGPSNKSRYLVILIVVTMGTILIIGLIQIKKESQIPKQENCITLNFVKSDTKPADYTRFIAAYGHEEVALLSSKKGVVSLIQSRKDLPFVFTLDDVESYSIKKGLCPGTWF